VVTQFDSLTLSPLGGDARVVSTADLVTNVGTDTAVVETTTR
jgi:hypothetical protein